jgi:alanine racemase
LAIGEDAEDKLSVTQRERFVSIRAEFDTGCPQAQFHLANSSAIWNAKRWGLDGLTDVVRPGISLYGVPPYPGAPARGLLPVMSLRTQVVATRDLKAGERVGYGGTFKAKEPVKIAIMASGYADGVTRSLGVVGTGPSLTTGEGSGTVLFGGERHSFIGIISMDLSAATCPASTRPGDWAQILGPGIDPWIQAKAASTIPYELLTSVGARVERVYS